MKKISAYIVATLAVVCLQAQILHYEVVRGSKKIGDMTVERRSYDNRVEYDIQSKVVFRILFSFTVDYESYALYQNEVLQKESTTNKLNGSVQKSSSIVKEGSSYVHTQNDVTHREKGPIFYSVASIYYVEPQPNQKVYSPQFGQYLIFEQIGNHKYRLESPDGINEYTYINGICTEVKVSRDFAKFYFKMAPESLYAVKNKLDSILSSKQ